MVAAGVPDGDRPDLAEAKDKAVRFSGFELEAPSADGARMRVFAVSGNRASELDVSTKAKDALTAPSG